MEEQHFGPVWFIPGENNGKYPFCHSVYIEGACVLIDPASDRKRLIQLRETPGIKAIWLTHWHEDHFMHLDLFDDLPLCISEQDAPPLSDLELFMDSYGISDDSRDYWRSFFKEQFHFRPRKPMRFLQGGETIHLGAVTVEAISTPGHTPGHLSFFFKEPEVLLMGDYDLTRFGPWYGDVDSSIEETIASVKRLRRTPAKVRLASHETGVFDKDPGEIWDKYLNVINEREEKIMNLLKEPQTLKSIVEAWIVYGKPREPRIFFEHGERATIAKHLEKLMNQGLVKMQDGQYHSL